MRVCIWLDAFGTGERQPHFIVNPFAHLRCMWKRGHYPALLFVSKPPDWLVTAAGKRLSLCRGATCSGVHMAAVRR